MRLATSKILQRARDSGSVPRVHGNGFVQLDVGGNERLHIWGHPDIPAQKVETKIHDHRFSFSSLVLVGRLSHTRYRVDAGPLTHKVYHPVPRRGEDTELVSSGTLVHLEEIPRQTIFAGSAYYLNWGELHETDAVPEFVAATLMRKYHVEDYTPRVLVPVGSEPDNDFLRDQHSESDLWRIVEEVLSSEDGKLRG